MTHRMTALFTATDALGAVLDRLGVTGDQVRLAISDPSGSTTDVARVFEIEVYGGTA